jgi:hypothetical protein
MQQPVMRDQAHEGTGGEQGIDAAEGAVPDPLLDVTGEIVVEHAVLVLEEHL